MSIERVVQLKTQIIIRQMSDIGVENNKKENISLSYYYVKSENSNSIFE